MLLTGKLLKHLKDNEEKQMLTRNIKNWADSAKYEQINTK
jgi:hypothetical protein